MPWIPPKQCKGCGISGEVTKISARGWCNDCGVGSQVIHNTQLHEHAGPAYNLWLRRYTEGMLRYLSEQGTVTVTDTPRDQ